MKNKCSIKNCGNDSLAKGFCNKHYIRNAKHGDPQKTLVVVGTGETPEQRFWSRIDIGFSDMCWEWQGGKSPDGYGVCNVKISGKRWLKATRLAYFLHYKVDPKNLNVLHQCDNPPCCNPNHLFLGTQAENIADMISKGRDNKATGVRHWKSKLTAEIVRQIKVRIKNGESQILLATEYGVQPAAINKIHLGKTWKEVA